MKDCCEFFEELGRGIDAHEPEEEFNRDFINRPINTLGEYLGPTDCEVDNLQVTDEIGGEYAAL